MYIVRISALVAICCCFEHVPIAEYTGEGSCEMLVKCVDKRDTVQHDKEVKREYPLKLEANQIDLLCVCSFEFDNNLLNFEAQRMIRE